MFFDTLKPLLPTYLALVLRAVGERRGAPKADRNGNLST
jgi:hypothetical protein